MYGFGQVTELFEPQLLHLISGIITLLKDCDKDEVELSEMMYVIPPRPSTEQILYKSGHDGSQ